MQMASVMSNGRYTSTSSVTEVLVYADTATSDAVATSRATDVRTGDSEKTFAIAYESSTLATPIAATLTENLPEEFNTTSDGSAYEEVSAISPCLFILYLGCAPLWNYRAIV